MRKYVVLATVLLTLAAVGCSGTSSSDERDSVVAIGDAAYVARAVRDGDELRLNVVGVAANDLPGWQAVWCAVIEPREACPVRHYVLIWGSEPFRERLGMDRWPVWVTARSADGRLQMTGVDETRSASMQEVVSGDATALASPTLMDAAPIGQGGPRPWLRVRQDGTAEAWGQMGPRAYSIDTSDPDARPVQLGLRIPVHANGLTMVDELLVGIDNRTAVIRNGRTLSVRNAFDEPELSQYGPTEGLRMVGFSEPTYVHVRGRMEEGTLRVEELEVIADGVDSAYKAAFSLAK